MKNVLATLSLVGLSACASSPPDGPSTTADRAPVMDGGPIAAQVAAAAEALDAIAAIPDDERTFENTVVALDDVVAEFFRSTRMTSFMASVSTDEEERERGREAAAVVGEWFSRFNKRRDLYHAVSVVADAEPELDAQAARLLELTLRDFRREGMELDEAQRERLLELDDELNRLSIDFRTNIADDQSHVLLTEDELVGCDPEFLATLDRAGDLFVVDLKGPTRNQVFTYCTVPRTRMKMSVALGRRAPENVALLEKILRLRNERAQLLGYDTTAAYETEVRMAKTPERVFELYDELRPKLRRKALADFEEFQEAKREDTGDPDAVLQVWDYSYYEDWLLRERYAVDSKKVVEYFPMEAVIDGLFSVTQSLYGVSYRKVTETAREAGRPIWHEDVELYEVWDDATGEMLGEFYLDLFPRDNKYSHAAQFPLVLRKRWADGSVTLPLVALVCNFTKPTAEKPSLLTHDEVVTFFHEFGHCLHSIFTKSDYANLSGTNVARDFVEAPSQMFENWVWDADVLSSFTRHYETGEPLPKELVDSMIAAKNLGSGMSAEGQVYLGMMDMAFHTDEDGIVDTTAVREEVYRETRLFEPLGSTFSQASFGHLMGYQAGYYGYLWSLVFASDMFSRFEKQGLMNRDVAREYRQAILSRGGTREELEMVRDFLGREPASDAFLRHLGLEE